MPVSTCSAAPPLPSGRARERLPFGNFIRRAEDRPQVRSGIGWRSAVAEAVEHIDRDVRRNRTHAARFHEMRDEKCLTAGLGKRTGDRRRCRSHRHRP